MKKTTRSSSRKSSASKATTRHAKSTAKPVTIELEATKVTSKPETAASDTPPPAVKRSSVPGAKPVSRGSLAPDDDNEVRFGRKSSPDDNTIADKVAETEEKVSKTSESAQAPTKSSAKTEQDNSKKPVTDAADITPAAATGNSGFGGKLVAGVVGGAIALGGAWLLQSSGLVSSSSKNMVSAEALSTARAELETSLNTLKTQIEQNATTLANKANVADVDTRIASSAKDVSEALASATGSDLDEVTSQVNETTKRVEDLQNQTQQATNALAELSKTVSGDQTAKNVETLKSQLEDAVKQIDLMSAQMTTLKAGAFDLTNRPEPEPADTPETIAAIKNLQSALPELKQDLTSQIENLSSTLAPRLEAVEKSAAPVSGLMDDVSSLKSGFETIVARAAEGETTIAALRDQSRQVEEQSKLSDQKATRAVAAAALKAQIDRGEPFSEALTNLKAVADPATELDGLAAFADTGVPTTLQLAAQFPDVAKAIAAAVAPPPPEDITSRLLSGARSFIKVQPLAPQEGDSPNALVQSIDSALSSNNLNDASAAWKKLPEPAQKVSAAWHDGLIARMTANTIVSKVVQTLLLDGAN